MIFAAGSTADSENGTGRRDDVTPPGSSSDRVIPRNSKTTDEEKPMNISDEGGNSSSNEVASRLDSLKAVIVQGRPKEETLDVLEGVLFLPDFLSCSKRYLLFRRRTSKHAVIDTSFSETAKSRRMRKPLVFLEGLIALGCLPISTIANWELEICHLFLDRRLYTLDFHILAMILPSPVLESTRQGHQVVQGIMEACSPRRKEGRRMCSRLCMVVSQ
jgi:hypothetical protein